MDSPDFSLDIDIKLLDELRSIFLNNILNLGMPRQITPKLNIRNINAKKDDIIKISEITYSLYRVTSDLIKLAEKGYYHSDIQVGCRNIMYNEEKRDFKVIDIDSIKKYTEQSDRSSLGGVWPSFRSEVTDFAGCICLKFAWMPCSWDEYKSVAYDYRDMILNYSKESETFYDERGVVLDSNFVKSALENYKKESERMYRSTFDQMKLDAIFKIYFKGNVTHIIDCQILKKINRMLSNIYDIFSEYLSPDDDQYGGSYCLMYLKNKNIYGKLLRL